MEKKKVWCEVLEAAVWSDRCLFKLSQIIEGNKSCESCILRELEKIKGCGKEVKLGRKRRSEMKRGRRPRLIVGVPKDTNDINDINDIKDINESDDIKQSLNVQDISKLLGKSKRRIQEMANLGKIPARKAGPHWAFDKAEIDRWLSEKKGGAGIATQGKEDDIEAQKSTMSGTP